MVSIIKASIFFKKPIKILDFIRGKVNFVLNAYLKRPPYSLKEHNYLLGTKDPIRYISVALAINRIKREHIKGDFAEVGVYKGYTSKIIHFLDPERKFYLFDTFGDFPPILLDKLENRFQDTNLEIIKKNIGNMDNLIIRKGIFPETTIGLENEKFSLVIIDVDILKSTLDALNFFYPRVQSGGYIFLHDYNNPIESNRGAYRAVNYFMKDKYEKLIEIPDKWGSVIIRKI